MKFFDIRDENYLKILSTIENLDKLEKEYLDPKRKKTPEKIFKKKNLSKVDIKKELE